MDLRLEAAALSELAKHRGDPAFACLMSIGSATGRDVLTLEWTDGVKMSDVAALAAAGHDLGRIAANVVPSFLRHTLRDELFPCRRAPRQYLRRGGRHDRGGRSRRFRPARQEGAPLPRRILYGFITRALLLRRGSVRFEAGYVPRTHNVAAFAQAIRAIGEPIHGQPAGDDLDGEAAHAAVRSDRAVRHADAARTGAAAKRRWCGRRRARTLDPAFDMWKTADQCRQPLDIRRSRRLRGLLSDAHDGVDALVSLARQAPDIAVRIERLWREIDAMAEHGLRFDDATARAIGKAEARATRWGRVALSAIALTLIWVGLAPGLTKRRLALLPSI